MPGLKDVSEAGEQHIIEAFFDRSPPKYRFLVDVGAFDKNFSNTWALLFNGWSGILLEPNPRCAANLRNQFVNLGADILECAAADKTAMMDLHLHSGYGHDSLLSSWDLDTKTPATIRVQAYRLCEILASKNVPEDFDFLSIDAEGYDKIILTDLFSFSKYRPRLIVTECTSYKGDLTIFADQGYSLIKKTGNPDYGNLILAREMDALPLVFKL
jgi:FkbM family methyltransferase